MINARNNQRLWLTRVETAMTRAQSYRTPAAELLSQAKQLTEHARRYLQLADQPERAPASRFESKEIVGTNIFEREH